MRKYVISVQVGMDTHSKIISAKNSGEAYSEALSFGHEKSMFGKEYLYGVHVKPVKNNL